MASTVDLLALVDYEGRVVAAQLTDQTKSRAKKDPSVVLVARKGQRAIHLDVPREVLKLPGSDLQLFFSHLKVTWPADVQLPKIEFRAKHKK